MELTKSRKKQQTDWKFKFNPTVSNMFESVKWSIHCNGFFVISVITAGRMRTAGKEY